jgi:hypothetical protein
MTYVEAPGDLDQRFASSASEQREVGEAIADLAHSISLQLVSTSL